MRYGIGRSLIAATAVWLSMTSGGSGFQALDRFSSYREDARAMLRASQTPGAAVVMVIDGQVVFAEGFGVACAEEPTPVTPDTLFQIGSLTKPFTAAAITLEARDARLSLEKPIGDFVAGLRPCLARVTLDELLSHTGGLIDEPDEYGPHDESSLAGYPRSWTDEYCMAEPRRFFSYSNSGFALAGFALQESAGKPYADRMSDLIFGPAGMSRTTFRPTVAMTYPLAVGHRVMKGRTEVVRPFADDARLWPAGGIFTTARDVSRFAQALLADGSVNGPPAFPTELLTKMTKLRASIAPLGIDYGHGLMLDAYRGLRRVGHDGSMPGFRAALAMIPDRHAAVVVLANLDRAPVERLADRALDTLLFEGTAAPEVPTLAAPGGAVKIDHPERYVGRYLNPRRWGIEIVETEGRLALRQFGQEWPLIPQGDDRFLAVPTGAPRPQTIVAVTGADGRAEAIRFAVWAFVREKTPVASSRADPAGLFAYDATAPLDVSAHEIDRTERAVVYDLTYASPGGGRVTAYLVAPRRAGRHAAVLFGHWGGGNRTEFLAEALLLAPAGVVSLLPDYPWTRPAPWRRNLRYSGGPEQDFEVYCQAVVDLRRGVDLLLARADVDGARLAYVGHSYGAQWGAILAAYDRRMKTAILAGGVPDLEAIYLGDDPDLAELRKEAPDRVAKLLGVMAPLAAVRHVGKAAPLPLLFQFARHEQNFDAAAMQRYYAAAREPKAIRWYPTGHDLNDPAALLDRAEWLRRHLRISRVTIQPRR